MPRWQGPISIAVYAPGSDLEDTIDAILYHRYTPDATLYHRYTPDATLKKMECGVRILWLWK